MASDYIGLGDGLIVHATPRLFFLLISSKRLCSFAESGGEVGEVGGGRSGGGA